MVPPRGYLASVPLSGLVLCITLRFLLLPILISISNVFLVSFSLGGGFKKIDGPIANASHFPKKMKTTRTKERKGQIWTQFRIFLRETWKHVKGAPSPRLPTSLLSLRPKINTQSTNLPATKLDATSLGEKFTICSLRHTLCCIMLHPWPVCCKAKPVVCPAWWNGSRSVPLPGVSKWVICITPKKKCPPPSAMVAASMIWWMPWTTVRWIPKQHPSWSWKWWNDLGAANIACFAPTTEDCGAWRNIRRTWETWFSYIAMSCDIKSWNRHERTSGTLIPKMEESKLKLEIGSQVGGGDRQTLIQALTWTFPMYCNDVSKDWPCEACIAGCLMGLPQGFMCGASFCTSNLFI